MGAMLMRRCTAASSCSPCRYEADGTSSTEPLPDLPATLAGPAAVAAGPEPPEASAAGRFPNTPCMPRTSAGPASAPEGAGDCPEAALSRTSGGACVAPDPAGAAPVARSVAAGGAAAAVLPGPRFRAGLVPTSDALVAPTVVAPAAP